MLCSICERRGVIIGDRDRAGIGDVDTLGETGIGRQDEILQADDHRFGSLDEEIADDRNIDIHGLGRCRSSARGKDHRNGPGRKIGRLGRSRVRYQVQGKGVLHRMGEGHRNRCIEGSGIALRDGHASQCDRRFIVVENRHRGGIARDVGRIGPSILPEPKESLLSG